jgi:hypothetical protein
MSTSNIGKGGPDSTRRRSQRVILNLPVTVRPEGSSRDASFEEETQTLVVNAHGALIALANKVEKGQTLLLTNRSSNLIQLCRVTYLGSLSDGKTQIGLEFLTPAPDFWRISFPPDAWTTQPEPATQEKK